MRPQEGKGLNRAAKPKLAIDGGTPVRSTLLPYGRQKVDEDDIQAVCDVLRSDWLTTGPKVGEFEQAFAARVGARYAIAVSSGTAALHAACFAAGLGPGDEAITTPLTFAATANSVLYQGARPVFADVRPDTLNLDPAAAGALVTNKTKAILPVDYTGLPADMDEFAELSRRNKLVVIEDAAHSLGATYKGRPVGALADMTVFSTHPVKHITTGEGGLVTTDDPQMAGRLRMFRNHGISTEARERHEKGNFHYEMALLGYNYRLSDIQCALGLSQLRKLDVWVERRRRIAAAYETAFSGMPELELPSRLNDRQSSWHLYMVRLRLETLRAGRDQIFHALRAENIGVNVHYIPVPWHPYYQSVGYGKGRWAVAETAYERILSLPIFPGMTDADVTDVLEAVAKVLSAYRR